MDKRQEQTLCQQDIHTQHHTALGNLPKKQQWDVTIHLLEKLNKHWHHQMLWWCEGKGTAVYFWWEYNLGVFYTNILLLCDSTTMFFVFSQRSWNLCQYNNLHMNVYSRFIHNYRNLGAPKMFLSRWVDKLWSI